MRRNRELRTAIMGLGLRGHRACQQLCPLATTFGAPGAGAPVRPKPCRAARGRLSCAPAHGVSAAKKRTRALGTIQCPVFAGRWSCCPWWL